MKLYNIGTDTINTLRNICIVHVVAPNANNITTIIYRGYCLKYFLRFSMS